MLSDGRRAAGAAEVWAARAWNVFNEGRPFGVVYPPIALAGALLIGVGPGGDLVLGLLAGLALSVVWARFSFPLRGRFVLWGMLPFGFATLEGWRSPGLLAVGLGGWAFFTVVVWGSVYYRLRTGAPWTNGLRFWRLVLTNSDPTSGNALEQLPKLTLTLSAIALVSEEPAAAWRVVVLAVVAAVLGTYAWRRFNRVPGYPSERAEVTAREPIARRVYVIVVDGCNRDRLRQASALGMTPHMDALMREGTEYLRVDAAYPARTVVCFSSMLTGAPPEEHGMRSNFAPRLGVRVPSVFDLVDGRLVGIAHLLDPFGDRVVRSVTSVQPTERLDHSLAAAGRRVVEEEDPDLLVLQLLAADQLGHVRGVRSPEYLDQLAATDERIGEFLGFLRESGRLGEATVILMADHGQGRGIGGHGHLDWGETPVPFAVWGRGAVPGGVCERPSSVLELAATIARLLGVPAPAAARGAPLVPVEDPDVRVPAPRRALAVIPAHDEEATVAAVAGRLPERPCGVPLDVLVVDDGSTDATAQRARAAGARVVSHPRNRGLGAAVRTGLAVARDEGYDAAVFLDGDLEYDPAQAERLLAPVLAGRAEYVLGSRFLGSRTGMSRDRSLANRAASALLGFLLGGRVLTDGQTGYRAFGRRALERLEIAHDYNYAQVLTLQLHHAGIDALEVPIDYVRRAEGRSFVSYRGYALRVIPVVWRLLRDQRRHSRTASAATPAASSQAATSAHAEPAP